MAEKQQKPVKPEEPIDDKFYDLRRDLVKEIEEKLDKTRTHLFYLLGTSVVVILALATFFGYTSFNDISAKMRNRVDEQFTSDNIKGLVDKNISAYTEAHAAALIEDKMKPITEALTNAVKQVEDLKVEYYTFQNVKMSESRALNKSREDYEALLAMSKKEKTATTEMAGNSVRYIQEKYKEVFDYAGNYEYTLPDANGKMVNYAQLSIKDVLLNIETAPATLFQTKCKMLLLRDRFSSPSLQQEFKPIIKELLTKSKRLDSTLAYNYLIETMGVSDWDTIFSIDLFDYKKNQNP